MDERFQIIDAFVDGEPVDPAALKHALSEAEGRDYLVDVWLLRDVVQDEIGADAAIPPRATAPRRRSWVIAAAVAAVCLIGGYIAGARLPGVFKPRTAGTLATEVAPVLVPTSFPVPPATRVIRLELDTNWKEGGGR